jgi:dGTPase
MEKAPTALESFFLQEWFEADSETKRLRVIIDQVASLTDPGAYSLYRELTDKPL